MRARRKLSWHATPAARSPLRPEAEAVLAGAAERIAAFPGARVIVEGHTDNIGTAAYNQRLSEDRAASVVRYLRTRFPTITFESAGYGDTRPASGNDTESGRQRNRRVEIRLTPAPASR